MFPKLIHLGITALVAGTIGFAASSLHPGPAGATGTPGRPGPAGPAGSAAVVSDLGFCAQIVYPTAGPSYVTAVGNVSRHADGTDYCLSGIYVPVTPGAGQS